VYKCEDEGKQIKFSLWNYVNIAALLSMTFYEKNDKTFKYKHYKREYRN